VPVRKIYSNISIRGGFAVSTGERDRRSMRREGPLNSQHAALEEDKVIL
jgi:hypothetical protein